MRLVKINAVGDFRLHLVFADGTEGEVDLAGRLVGPMFEPVRDPDYFASVSLDEFGAPCWPNGADWAPDALYQEGVGRHGSEPRSDHRS
ncbi:MAG: DUF2442 domain-containing protein [Myxococcota bacterium]